VLVVSIEEMGRRKEDTDGDAGKAHDQGHYHGQASKFPLSSRAWANQREPIGHLELIQLGAQRHRQARL
jgi:hypothetical protein